jgi:hypothetical protein
VPEITRGVHNVQVFDSNVVGSSAGRKAEMVELTENTSSGPTASTATGDRLGQVWCASVSFNDPPDGRYIAEATASGLGNDGNTYWHLAQWWADVVYPAAVPPTGSYVATTLLEGADEFENKHRARTTWWASLSPDPSQEPDVVLHITPHLAYQTPPSSSVPQAEPTPEP